MPIKSVYIKNFKGIKEEVEIAIAPLTFFIGANSSGKSSCIHALACLAQTVKVTNDTRPIILDDEYANVHLGRFIEVIHSKSYDDLITLGITTSETRYPIKVDANISFPSTEIKATYSFKSSKRTQEISLEHASIKVKENEYIFKKDKSTYKSHTTLKPHEKRTYSRDSGPFFTADFTISADENYINDFITISSIQNKIKEELTNTYYLGPFRQGPLRKYQTRGSSPNEVGSMGEATTTLLANETIQKSRNRSHITQIAGWLSDLGLAKDIDIKRIGNSDLFDISIKLNDEATFPIADLGYGLSQILPVLTQCSFAPNNSTLLFEQPEIHLHSISARNLAKVFTDTMKEKKCHILVETHAPELIKQILQYVKEGTLEKTDVALYRVSRENTCTRINKIQIETGDGWVDVEDNWEKGISTP